MVTTISLVPTQPELLVSGAADGTVRTWRHMQGTPLFVESINIDSGAAGKDAEGDEEIVSSVVCSPVNGDVAVVLERCAKSNTSVCTNLGARRAADNVNGLKRIACESGWSRTSVIRHPLIVLIAPCAFGSRTLVLVFELSADGKLRLRDKLDLSAVAVSATFTSDGTLVTAAATETTPIRAFRLQDDQVCWACWVFVRQQKTRDGPRGILLHVGKELCVCSWGRLVAFLHEVVRAEGSAPCTTDTRRARRLLSMKQYAPLDTDALRKVNDNAAFGGTCPHVVSCTNAYHCLRGACVHLRAMSDERSSDRLLMTWAELARRPRPTFRREPRATGSAAGIPQAHPGPRRGGVPAEERAAHRRGAREEGEDRRYVAPPPAAADASHPPARAGAAPLPVPGGRAGDGGGITGTLIADTHIPIVKHYTAKKRGANPDSPAVGEEKRHKADEN